MDDPLLPIIILIVLIFINAVFAAAEIAIISLSEAKLKKQAEDLPKWHQCCWVLPRPHYRPHPSFQRRPSKKQRVY